MNPVQGKEYVVNAFTITEKWENSQLVFSLQMLRKLMTEVYPDLLVFIRNNPFA